MSSVKVLRADAHSSCLPRCCGTALSPHLTPLLLNETRWKGASTWNVRDFGF